MNPADDIRYIPVTPIPPNVIPGTSGDDILEGSKDSEFFVAGEGSDIETGDGGSDVFLMGPGRDFIGGGGGIDSVIFEGHSEELDPDPIPASQPTIIVTDTNPADGDSGVDRISGVEFYEFEDGVFDAVNEEFIPKEDGTLSYEPITPIPMREGFGTPGGERLIGSKVAEFFDAGGGRDTSVGNGGDDVFLMGEGDDFIGGGGGNDTAIFDGVIEDYAGLIFDGDLVYFITDANPDDGDSGRDRLGGVETFEFKDAIFDATTGDVTFKNGPPPPPPPPKIEVSSVVSEADIV